MSASNNMKCKYTSMTRWIAGAVLCGALVATALAKEEPAAVSQRAAAVDAKIDWRRAELIAVQDNGRYKTFDSFSREWLSTVHGRDHLEGLSPEASTFEWLFNRAAYRDVPVIKIRDAGLLAQFATVIPEAERATLLRTKRLTSAQLADPAVDKLLRQMDRNITMRRAVNRVREAQALSTRLEEFFAPVPQPAGDRVAPWFGPDEALANLTDEQLGQLGLTPEALRGHHRIPGMTPEQAWTVTLTWNALKKAWLDGDAPHVQEYVDRLATLLPSLAAPEVYPTLSQRSAEARYYRFGKFTWAWGAYFLAALTGVWAMLTRWRVPFVITFVLTLVGLACHAYGLGLRWYILGRIPIANAFEAVVGASCLGVIIALVLVLIQRSRVLLVAASTLGFAFLLCAQFVLPRLGSGSAGSELQTMMGILDDVQLRLHTVMIITAYALCFVGAVIGVVYLVGYYVWEARRGPALAGAPVGKGTMTLNPQRPLLSGAIPGDESTGEALPQWLNELDWTHLIVLNIVFILLFVGGVVLGAWWADYSWGRPWGWDPKEVFALNTWIIYAILLHTRFVVKRRGLWTAWLSIIGCTMMAFNWFFVNFYIQSVHSYA